MTSAWILLGGAPLAFLAGWVRGMTGFGGSMVFTAPMALVAGPETAVVVALILEGFAALNMLPDALRQANARILMPLCVAACVTAPLGTFALTELDPLLLRRLIAATVLLLAFVMLRGFRYNGPQRTRTAAAMGGLSGLLVSATSVGAPPVILYLLSGPDSISVTRSNLTIFIVAISVAALAVLGVRGALDMERATTAAILAPCFFAGAWLGSRMFPHVDDKQFRRFALWFLIAMSTVLLLV